MLTKENTLKGCTCLLATTAVFASGYLLGKRCGLNVRCNNANQDQTPPPQVPVATRDTEQVPQTDLDNK